MIHSPQDRVKDVEWLVTCLVAWGANDVQIEVDNRQIKAIHFQFPSGRACRLEYPNHVARPCLIVGRGRVA
jgi:hypothetical protein